jgi:hypothetical protein
VAAVDAGQLDRSALQELAGGHRREDTGQPHTSALEELAGGHQREDAGQV